MDTYKLASSQAANVQRSMNEAADIGIDAVVPDPNVDQVDGIIHGISTARDYYHYEESFLDQVENFPEGVVDDTVRANADFQYHAGLSPTIERKTDGKCCPWCSRLAGTYPYEDVRNTGNDVFRRHRNCHCQVLFNPGDGSKRRQNVHSRQWTDESQNDRISSVAAGKETPDVEDALRADLEKTQWEKVNPNRMQRIQNGFSAFPEEDVLNKRIKNVKPYKDYFDIAMHGDCDAVGFGSKIPNMKARDLAKIIRRDERYTGGPVRLLCCSTGLRIGDEYCFAEELSNALRQVVMAPNDTLYIHKNGDLEIGRDNIGAFVSFRPNERRRIR
jgi:hypothetical protein